MPELKQSAWSAAGCVVALVFAVLVFVVFAYWRPWSAMFVIAFWLGAYLLAHFEVRRDRRWLLWLVKTRPQGSICTFARSFDCRQTDTWIIRATWEQIQRSMPPGLASFPLLRWDRLKEDLRLDEEAIDELGVEIAERCGRTWDDVERNPFYARVCTVSDLVGFLSHQPFRRPHSTGLSRAATCS